ncbi:FecR domain-containing protein [Pseudoflavitalea rhizosphaerae]|uniref:FecR domain-containing protein n=1 Tax=Pseudoflavitalea rhizosphaerae TaxID=1884793 RepID=UPI000F8C9850|nr:FecR domain-containing protein [Pseudoflavitalea rhizosphaerae]
MNAEFYNISDDLLVKYLLGEASAGEREEVEHWIGASPDNLRYYEQFKFIWDESQELAAKSSVNENDAWKRFQQRISREESTPEMTLVEPARTKWYDTRIAAAVIMLVGVAALLFFILVPFKSGKQVVLSAKSQSKAETLPDGSVVTLNKNSTISYTDAFKGKDRTVKLKGEAFFQVKADIKKPFIVTINDVTITVLGTSFNVKSNNGKTEVVVESGLVKVEYATRSIQLKQKEKLEVETGDTVLVKEPVTDQFYKFYRTREFVCDDTPLWKLVQAMNESYHVNILIENPEFRNIMFTGTYYDMSLQELLDMIVDTSYPLYDITVEKKDSFIILK